MSLAPKRLLLAGVTLVLGLVAVALLYLALSSPFETLAVYDVEGDVLRDREAPPAHSEVWNRFNEIFPADTHPEISRFRAIDAENSNGIDGSVFASNSNRTEWELVLDTTYAYGKNELDRTMIHEFAHLLTLRTDQIPLGSSHESCAVYAPPEGCPAQSSYLHAYFSEFWADYTTEDYSAEEKGEGGDCAAECAKRFGTGEFVTEYAATIPTEDIAETFAEWVISDGPPEGSAIQARKFEFFERYPELVTLREKARAGLGEAS